MATTLRRKLAIASWGRPREGNIYGKVVDELRPGLIRPVARVRSEEAYTVFCLGATLLLLCAAVIGGVLTSSLLTLVVVPVVYCYLDDLAQWLRRGRRTVSGGAGGDPVAASKMDGLS